MTFALPGPSELAAASVRADDQGHSHMRLQCWKAGGRDESLNRLVGKKGSASVPTTAMSMTFPQAQTQTQAQTDAIARVKKKKSADAEAKIVLKEEKAAIFHDFLKFVYPQCVHLPSISFLLGTHIIAV